MARAPDSSKVMNTGIQQIMMNPVHLDAPFSKYDDWIIISQDCRFKVSLEFYSLGFLA